MTDFFRVITTNFWTFIGSVVVLLLILGFGASVVRRISWMLAVIVRGWPSKRSDEDEKS